MRLSVCFLKIFFYIKTFITTTTEAKKVSPYSKSLMQMQPKQKKMSSQYTTPILHGNITVDRTA